MGAITYRFCQIMMATPLLAAAWVLWTGVIEKSWPTPEQLSIIAIILVMSAAMMPFRLVRSTDAGKDDYSAA